MATTFSLERVRHYLVPALAGVIGLGVALGIATVPSDVLNAAVDRGGLSGILPAAASPIGATGRTLLALVAGLLIASCGFVPQLKATLVSRLDAYARRPRGGAGERAGDAPVVRRADAHPDAPPRRPIRAASDLGAPLPIFGEEDRRSAPLPPPVVQSLPDDLDRPLADFDPAAVPLRPMAPPEPVAPLLRATEPPARPTEPAAPAPRFAWLAPEEAEEASVSHVEAAKPAELAPPVAAAPRVWPEPGPRDLAYGTERSDPLSETASPSSASFAGEPHIAASRPATMSEPSPREGTAPAERGAPAFATVSTPREPTATPPHVVPPAPMSRSEVTEPVARRAPLPDTRAAPAPTIVCDPVAVVSSLPTASHASDVNGDESIAGLLARLERGAAAQRRSVVTRPAPATVTGPTAPAPGPDPQPEPVSLDATLQRLRRLAAG